MLLFPAASTAATAPTLLLPAACTRSPRCIPPPCCRLPTARHPALPPHRRAAFGLPAAVLAAVYAALPAGSSLREQRFMLVGESPRLGAIAETLEEAVQRESGRGTVLEARKALHLVDAQARGSRGGDGGCWTGAGAAGGLRWLWADPAAPRQTANARCTCTFIPHCRRAPGQGLVVRDRPDAETLDDYKLPYAQDRPPCAPGLLAAIKETQPTVLIGLSDDAPPHAFGQDVIQALCAGAERPIVLPLSRMSPQGVLEQAEVSAADALAWSQARAPGGLRGLPVLPACAT